MPGHSAFLFFRCLLISWRLPRSSLQKPGQCPKANVTASQSHHTTCLLPSCHISGNEPQAPGTPCRIQGPCPFQEQWRLCISHLEGAEQLSTGSQLEEGTYGHKKGQVRQKHAVSSPSFVDPSPNKASLQGTIDRTDICLINN